MALSGLAISGIGAGIGALGNALFGGQDTLTDADIEKLMSEMPSYDDAEARSNLQRRVSAMLKNRQRQTSQKNASLGINDPQAVYAYDDAIYNAQAEENARIDEIKAQDEANKKKVRFDLKYQQMMEEKNKPNLFERLVEGGITGFNVGSQVAKLNSMDLDNKIKEKALKDGNTQTITQNNSQNSTQTFEPLTSGRRDLIAENKGMSTGLNTDPEFNPEVLAGKLGYGDMFKNLAGRYGLNYGKMKSSMVKKFKTK